mgnify:CR=1 FL=1
MALISRLIELLRWGIRVVDGVLSQLMQVPSHPDYEVAGACKKRGVCCQNIVVCPSSVVWKSWVGRKVQILWYRLVYRFVCRVEDDVDQVLVFRCLYLKGGLCSIYERRPHICRDYPAARAFGKPELLSGCGYVYRNRDRGA